MSVEVPKLVIAPMVAAIRVRSEMYRISIIPFYQIQNKNDRGRGDNSIRSGMAEFLPSTRAKLGAVAPTPPFRRALAWTANFFGGVIFEMYLGYRLWVEAAFGVYSLHSLTTHFLPQFRFLLLLQLFYLPKSFQLLSFVHL